ncbi:MAG: SpoIIE family protein phosphatase [Bacteroidetes bacterium]|nr:SpoIIE family protein phosphatase [Bacteroidota bacterium]
MGLKIFNRLANIGIDDTTPFNVRNKLKVFNNAILVILFISLFYCCVGIIQRYWIAVLVTFYSTFSNILSLFLVKKGYYKWAFHYTMWYGYIFLSAFSFLFGGANNSYYYFLFIPVACNIMFDNIRTTLIYVAISAFLMIGSIYYIDHYPPYYDLQEWMRSFSYPNIIFVTLLIYLGVRLFKLENQKYSHQIEEQKKVLEEKNQEITDSINYAKKIQSALIPSEEEFNSHFSNSFVLFKPKDIVSGDFYWVTRQSNRIYYATGDCTGHGVPGGFMTMLGISFLDEIINGKSITEPAEVLDVLRERIVHTLKQTGTAGENKDGMDIVLCCIDIEAGVLKYAAANNSLYIFKGNVFTEYKPDKQPCGFYHTSKPFTQHEIKINKGDCIYTFTDGFADQFGGPKGKKFKYKKLEELTLALQNLPLAEQKASLDKTFEDWRGNLEQLDDVCMVGVKI